MKFTSISLCAVLSMLCSCSSDPNNLDTPPKSGSPVTLSGTKSTTGFEASGDFKVDSKIGIYMTTAATPLQQSGNHANNTLFTASASGFTTTSGLVYPEGVANVDFYAYAPYSSTGIDASQKISFSVEATQTAPENSDLLLATQPSVASGTTPALLFNHKLAQVVITLEAASGVTLSSPVVTLAGTLPTVKMNLANGTLDNAEGSVLNISPTVISPTELHAIIIPQTVTKGTEFILVKNGIKTFIHALSKDFTFLSGAIHTFKITVKNNAIDVNFTGSINGWTPGDTTPGDAI